MDWMERWQRRQYDIAKGVDADLFRDCARRSWMGLGIMSCGLVIGLVGRLLHYGPLRYVLLALAGTLFAAGWFVFAWAYTERRVLRRPDPEPPPSVVRADPEKPPSILPR